jgi:RNA polymerase sigma factor (sigma-70 family)
MVDDESVTEWLTGAKAADPAAQQRLWDRYLADLLRVAAAAMRGAPRRAADEHDAVVVAFEQFFRGAADGRFVQLTDRSDLSQVLHLLTRRRAVDLARRAWTRRAGEIGESALGQDAAARAATDPAFAVELADDLCARLAGLPEDLRAVVRLKLEGCANAEIAARLGCTERTVERKLERVRGLWAGPAAG